MCGICGVISGNLVASEENIFEALLFLNVFRGKDSTGVMRVLKNKREVEIEKSLKPSPVAIYDKEDPIAKILSRSGSNALIGHCRAATKGSVTIDNAHPFEFSDVAGVHNGTIHKKFKGTEIYGTDSEALYALINDVGITEALNEVQGWETPAYALCWYDKRDGLMRFVHNSQRPINFGFLYAGSTLAFSSEADTLRTAVKLAAKHQTLSTEKVLKEKSDVFCLHKHQMFVVDPTNVREYDFEDLKIKEHVRPAASSYSQTNRGVYGGNNYEDLMGHGHKLSRKERKALKKSQNFRYNFAKGYEGEDLSWVELDEHFKKGCVMCGEVPMTTAPMAQAVTWIDDESFICVPCSRKHNGLVTEWKEGGFSEASYDHEGKVLN